MKTLMIISLPLFTLIAIAAGVASTDNDCLRYENHKLQEMNRLLLEYADKTADTGELDDFIQSDEGQAYFELQEQLVNE